MGLSPVVLDHVHNRRNVGPLLGATHRGQAGDEGGGPYMVLEFKVEGGVVVEAAYQTYGCPVAVACGSFVAQYSIGRGLDGLRVVEARDLVLMLSGVPEGKEHCAELAVVALRKAVEGDEVCSF